jgi:bacillithiol synthase
MARSVPLDALYPRGGLFVDCWQSAPRLMALLPHDFRDPRAWQRQAQALESRPRDREGLRDVLAGQNRAFSAAAPALAQIEKFADPRAVAVVGGQQAGLFTGPLYTIHKALTILRLAGEMESRLGRPVVPVFWIASEDSDLAEIDNALVLDTQGALRPIAMPRSGHPAAEGRLPVSQVRFTDEVRSALDRLAGCLPESAFSASLLQALASCYAPGRSYPQAFARLMAWLFSERGLVLVDPSEVRLKRMAGGLFRREIEERSPVSAAVREQSARLAAAGYRPHIEVREDILTLFHQDPDRQSVAVAGEGFLFKGSGKKLSAAELLAMLESDPHLFSANALLRPLYQDTLFPTLAAVLGPAELAYFSQLPTAYARLDLPMPILFPRASVTLLEKKVARAMDRLGLDLGGVLTSGGGLLDAVLRKRIPADLAQALADGRAAAEGSWKGLAARIAELDPTLRPTAGIASARALKQFEFIEKKVLRAARRREGELRAQVEKVTSAILPRGGLQERALNAMPLLARHGTRLLDVEAAAVDIFSPVHHCVEVEP